MMRTLSRAAIAVLVLGMMAPAQEERTARQILKELKAIKNPARPGDMTDQVAVDGYLAALKEANGRRVALIGELREVNPKNTELKKLLPQRWLWMDSTPEEVEGALKEIDEALAEAKDAKFRQDILYAKSQLVIRSKAEDREAVVEAVEAYLDKAPKNDKRGAQLLDAVIRETEDEGRRKELEARILADFPKTEVADAIRNERRPTIGVGGPFKLEFVDAINGSKVSVKGLRGKVVVVDFWATWCGPCVAEMPKMKELYQKYKGQGVEFIGVSLDKPIEDRGLDRLRAFVKKNEIGWPQYYQGNGWESEFSKSWGVTGLPCVFVVDHKGNLVTTEGRGKLEELIPALLRRAKAGGG